ncbi:MAG: hypothetical protein WDN06_03670 [Asticcacaulis sp.]
MRHPRRPDGRFRPDRAPGRPAQHGQYRVTAYVQRYGVPQTLQDLDHHRLVHYVAQLGNKPDGFEYFDGQAYRCYRMPGQVYVDNTLAYHSAVVAGLGIVQAPRIALLDHVKAVRCTRCSRT